MKKRNVISGAMSVCMIAALTLTGCGGSSSSAAESSSAADTQTVSETQGATDAESSGEKVLTAGTAAGYFGASDMDPAEEWNSWYMSFFGITENLFRLDASYNANPCLVDTYENVDEYTWQFTLRDDVTFHNGEKMTADSVKACFERTYQENARAAETLAIDTMTADGQVLTIKTKEPNPTILADLCDPLLGVYYVGDDVDYKSATPATGPFIMETFTANEQITLAANDNYWGGDVQLDKAVLKTINDADALTMALQSGDIDVAVAVPASSLSVCNDETGYVVNSVPTTRGHFLRFNMESTAVADPIVREAISMCIDRDSYSEIISSGTTVPNYGVYPTTLDYGKIDNLSPLVTSYDVDSAKKLLEDAGYADTDGNGILEKDGNELNIKLATISTRSEFIELCDVLTSTLSTIGINLQVEAYEKLESADQYSSIDWDITMDSKGMAPTGNAQYFINSDFVTGASANYGHYSNATVDTLAGQLASTFDADERNAIIYQIEQQILDETSYVFFANQNFVCISNTSVSDFNVQPSEYYFLDAVMTVQ